VSYCGLLTGSLCRPIGPQADLAILSLSTRPHTTRSPGNLKKHGRNQNNSRLNPRIVPEIIFDTSRSRLLELYYDGAIKRRELLVTNPVPIPYRVDVADGAGTVIGNAADIIRGGFAHWLPLIKQLGVLDGTGREEEALREVLFPGQEG